LDKTIIAWIVFGVIVAAALAVDVFLVSRQVSRPTLKRAVLETCAWITVSLIFGVWVYVSRGHQSGIEFFTAYLLEKSLSADNIFIFLLIFSAFGIEPDHQHRVLYTGILGALAMRLAFILIGVQLLSHFRVALYVFGAALIAFGLHMLLSRRTFRPEDNWLMRLVRKIHPVDASYCGEKFWIYVDGRRILTPLLLALVAIEAMDLIFAIDSIPAVLAITRDSFVAYSSNVFAILGLRAMYFGLAELMARMRFLHRGLAVILLFVGAKMLLSERIPIPTHISLGVIAGILGIASVASWLAARKA